MESSNHNPSLSRCPLCQNYMDVMLLASPPKDLSGINAKLCQTCNLVYLTAGSIKNSDNYRLVPQSLIPFLSSNQNSKEPLTENSSEALSLSTVYEALLRSFQQVEWVTSQVETPTTPWHVFIELQRTLRLIVQTISADLNNLQTNGVTSIPTPTPSSSCNHSPQSDQRTHGISTPTSAVSPSNGQSPSKNSWKSPESAGRWQYPS